MSHDSGKEQRINEQANETPTAGQYSGEPAAPSKANDGAIEEYLSMYEMVGEDESGVDAYYEPTEGEKILIADAINGLLADSDFVKTYDAWRLSVLTSERDEALAEVERLRDADTFSRKELARGNEIIDQLRIERDRLRAENAELTAMLETCATALEARCNGSTSAKAARAALTKHAPAPETT